MMVRNIQACRRRREETRSLRKVREKEGEEKKGGGEGREREWSE